MRDVNYWIGTLNGVVIVDLANSEKETKISGSHVLSAAETNESLDWYWARLD